MTDATQEIFRSSCHRPLGPDGGDVPRNQQGVALIGDPRNDVHRS
jgi:hypothetical protein